MEGAHVVGEVQLVKDSQKSASSLFTCVCVYAFYLHACVCVNTYEGGAFRWGSGAGQMFSKVSFKSIYMCRCDIYSLLLLLYVYIHMKKTLFVGETALVKYSQKSASSLLTCICVYTYEKGTCRRGSGACEILSMCVCVCVCVCCVCVCVCVRVRVCVRIR